MRIRPLMENQLAKFYATANLALALWLWLNCLPVYAKPSTQEKAIELKQVHDFLGPTRVLISSSGILLENTGRMAFSVVSSAPDWIVTVYRKDDKKYFSESFSEFERNGLWSDLLSKRYAKENHLTGSLTTVNRDGFPIVRIVAPKRALEYFPRRDLPTQIEAFLRTIYKVPTNGEIPISFEKIGGRTDITGLVRKGENYNPLKTTSIKTVTVNPTVFAKPQNFRLIKDVRSLLVGQNDRKRCEDIDVLFNRF